MAPTIENDVSLDNIKGGEDSNDTYIIPDFMPAAQDIMNWFPCPNAASSTKNRAFHKTFRTNPHIVENLWFLLNQEDLQPVSECPKHLVWALYFMKVYPQAGPRLCGHRRVRRSCQSKDPPKMGLGLYQECCQAHGQGGEFIYYYFIFILTI